MIKTVTKTNGTVVDFDASKLNKMAEWGSTLGLDWSKVTFDAIKKVNDGAKTSDIQQALIDTCAEQKTPEYLAMASRLFLGTMRKEVFNSFDDIPYLDEFYHDMVAKGVWTEMRYDDAELMWLEEVIDHDKDFGYTFATLKQAAAKYMKKLDGKLVETPQFMNMGIAMAVMENQPADRRLHDVAKYYEYLSDLKINLPTPFLAGLRTNFKGLASCAVLAGDDTADSIAAAVHGAYKMTLASAGIGMHLRTRSLNDDIRNGAIKHGGKLPYYRYLEASVKSSKQGTRGGSATTHFNILDPEIVDLLALKHVTTVQEKQIRGLDYSVGINRYFMEKAIRGEKWKLISDYEGREVNSAFYADYNTFKAAYESYEGKHKEVDALTLLTDIVKMRQDTGRLYIHWADEMNTNTPFKDTIFSSNLCQEIFLPTKGYEDIPSMYSQDMYESEGEIALCFLSSIVAGRVKEKEYEDVAYYAILAIDNCMDIMEYPFPHLEETAKARRSIGCGVTNLAHHMASNKRLYTTTEGKNFIHRHMELHQYSCIKASNRLAKEKGTCEWYSKTKWNEGWMPIDTYNKNVDSVHTQPLLQDWEGLRKEIAKYGLRNSTTEATPPAESSSQFSNTTNAIYPIREAMVQKKSGSGVIVFEAPEYAKYAEWYQSAWDVPTKDMIDLYAITQKFHSQGVSADLYVDYSKYPDEKVPATDLIRYLAYGTKMGLKALYYQNSRTSGGEIEVEGDADCSSCKL